MVLQWNPNKICHGLPDCCVVSYSQIYTYYNLPPTMSPFCWWNLFDSVKSVDPLSFQVIYFDFLLSTPFEIKSVCTLVSVTHF